MWGGFRMSEKKPEHKHDAHKHVYMEHEQHAKNKSYKTATWILGGVSLLLLVGLIVSLALGGGSGAKLSESEVRSKASAYLSSQGYTATINSVKFDGGLYKIDMVVNGQPFTSYASPDGKFLFPQGIDMTDTTGTGAQQEPADTNVPKTDKPVVELFIMSHCPFGTQAAKGILPAVRTLGDNIDFKVKFVYYAMHGEKEVKEQLVQYCIQKNQPAEYLKYLACFLNDTAGQGSAAASDACIASTGVNKAQLETCKVAADKEFNVMANLADQSTWLSGRFPKFDTDLADNTKYGVGGSPTLVINGVQSNAGRDSQSYLTAICNAFNNAPAECSTQLSTVQPGPGFGYDSVGAAQAAGCGV